MADAARRLVSIDDVVAMLAQRAELLAQELLPAGKRDGAEWRVGSIAGEPGRSLAVHLRGGRAGVWKDFHHGEAGDALDLVAAVRFGGDKKRALEWSRRWLGLDAGDPAAVEGARRAAERAKEARVRDEADAAKRQAYAKAIWLDGVPAIGSPVEMYLARRGIALRDFRQPPSALRFAPRLWCAESAAELPAMVAAITGPDGQHVATHRTWLAEDGRGNWRKSAISNPKKTIGALRGGFIRLTRGDALTPWKQTKPDETVAFAEGIETALSVASLMPEWRVGCAVSLSNMAALVLPDNIREVVVCADNDADNPRADEMVEKAVANLQRQGASVRLARPESRVKDWNDSLIRDLRAEGWTPPGGDL
jgi:hypothetical protein